MGGPGWSRLGWAVPGGFVDERWALGCSGGVLQDCGLRWGGGVCGARSGLVDSWVMHGMVMDETLHVFPGSGVFELFRVCQQKVLAVYHLSRCSADCL